MKKTIITALIALLIMLAVTACDSFIPEPEAEQAEYTADGQRLVTVKVNTSGIVGSNRSITTGFAHEAATYMEVVFKKGSNYYRAEGFWNFPLSVKIPKGEYTVTEAVILIGRKSDKTLLATGKLTGTEQVTGDTSITFDVSSLVVNLNAAVGSSFEIDEDSSKITSTSMALSDGDFKDETKAGLFMDHPCFQVPTKATITAKLDIPSLTDSAGNGDKIVVMESKKLAFPGSPDPAPVTPVEITTIIGDSDITKVSFTPIPNSTTSSLEDAITITFNTKNAGTYLIVFNIPVVGLGLPPLGKGEKTYSTDLMWFIRGGTKLGPDFDGTSDSGVVLLVTDSPANGGGVVAGVEPNW